MAVRRSAVGPDRTVLVTVGTTKFDDLIRAVDKLKLTDILVSKGYTELLIQKGSGAHYPKTLLPDSLSEASLTNGLKVRCFDFLPSLAQTMSGAALIISHAGSGSLFEALSSGKAVLAVPNPILMDNHQEELAEQLASMKHLVCATPATLARAIEDLDPGRLVPYIKGDASLLTTHISQVLGVNNR